MCEGEETAANTPTDCGGDGTGAPRCGDCVCDPGETNACGDCAAGGLEDDGKQIEFVYERRVYEAATGVLFVVSLSGFAFCAVVLALLFAMLARRKH